MTTVGNIFCSIALFFFAGHFVAIYLHIQGGDSELDEELELLFFELREGEAEIDNIEDDARAAEEAGFPDAVEESNQRIALLRSRMDEAVEAFYQKHQGD